MATEDKLKEFHREALATFDEIWSAQEDVREQCIQDRRFYSVPGAQWEGALGDQFTNKPKFEVNKSHLAVIRIINEYRNNQVTVDFVSKNGIQDDKLADTLDGLFRADQEYSNADEAYDNAFEEAVAGGFGAYRLRAIYEDDEDANNEYQRICIEPIVDADSCVFFDNDAKRQDKRDAKWCFVLTGMTPKAYKAEFDDSPASWPKPTSGVQYDWATPDLVYVAEVYKVEEKRDKRITYVRIDGSEVHHLQSVLAEKPEIVAELEAAGATLDRSKPVKTTRIHKYIMSGGRVLEDCGYIAGKYIPVIPVYGKRWYVEGTERCQGHIRLAKDTQRLANMQRSKLAEISALSSVSKPIVTPEQIAGHQTAWSRDNIDNYAYLLLNAITDAEGTPIPAGPLGYTKSPEIPPAMAALLGVTEQDLNDLLGNQQAGEVLEPNMSGKAVELVQNRLDMQVFIYMSNYGKAKKHEGCVWLSMAKELYVEEGRKMKSVNEDGSVGSVELQKKVYVEGDKEYENDIAGAKFDVSVTVGPSSSSRRSATVRALTGMMTISTDPETIQVLGSMAMMNMEGEGIDDVRDFFRRKMLRMGVVKPTEEEQAELAAEAQNQQPDANTAYLTAAAQNEMAKAKKAEADTLLTLAKTEQAKADTLKTMDDIDSQQHNDLISGAQALGQAATALGQDNRQPLGL